MNKLWKTAAFTAHFPISAVEGAIFLTPYPCEGAMKAFQQVVFAACVVGLSPIFAATAQPTECSSERPTNARAYWSYRLIDGRKCWYEGKPMLSKSLLHWPLAPKATAGDPEQEPSIPAARHNSLDAQAFMPDDSDSFEANWKRRVPEAVARRATTGTP